MTLCFYNTLNNRKEEFRPIDEKLLSIYSCGPTLYDYPHIGNYKTYIFEDVLRRYLKYRGYAVKQVMNLTDVDDKTIRNSRRSGMTLRKFTDRYAAIFFEDLDSLKIERVEVYPRATEHIDDMVALIKILMDRGIAYKGKDGSIYYDITGFPGYGKLSNIRADELKAGVHVREDEYGKQSAGDFALWKAWDENDGDVFWETELGRGRPGWHIECSAMSTKYLGSHFDIHTGGTDNIFPHHENEIAQCEAATGQVFVNYWLHSEHLLVEGEKMSKSLGNFYTLRDLLGMGYDPLAVRLLLIGTRYRQKLNFTIKSMEAAEKTLDRLQNFALMVDQYHSYSPDDPAVSRLVQKARSDFEAAMDDDLNTSAALSAIFDLMREVNRRIESGMLSEGNAREVVEILKRFDLVLALLFDRRVVLSPAQRQLMMQRNMARDEKNWQLSDEIRKKLEGQGLTIVDMKFGSVVKQGNKKLCKK